MSCSAPSGIMPPPILLDPKANWITPEEQLYQLALNKIGDQFSILHGTLLKEPIIKRLPLSILKPSGLSGEEDEEDEKHVPRLFDLCREQLLESLIPPKSLTDWYRGLERIEMLPQKIPPLPKNIHQIMDSKCPIYGDQLQRDGTYFKVKDTHFLSLIPEEFGTVDQLERIMRTYLETHYRIPFKDRYDLSGLPPPRLDVLFPNTHWVLMTKDVLPESRDKTWENQLALVDALSEKSLVNYEVPTLQQSVAAIYTNQIATNKTFYTGEFLSEPATLTRVKETGYGGCHISIGGFEVNTGLSISEGPDDLELECIGIAALRKL